FTAPVLQALGRSHLVARLEWTRALTGFAFFSMVGMIVQDASSENQVLAIAGTRLVLNALLVIPVFVFFLNRYTGISLRDLIIISFPPISASAAIILIISLINIYDIFSGYSILLGLAVKSLIAGTIGLITLFFLDYRLRRLMLCTLRTVRVWSRDHHA